MEKKNFDVTVIESGAVTPDAQEDPGTGGGGMACCLGCATCTNWGK